MIKINTNEIILRIPPNFIISNIVTLPVPNIIAFGGVATGSINDAFVAKAADSMSMIGLIPNETPSIPTIGISNVAVAVVEVISVRSKTEIIITLIITM